VCVGLAKRSICGLSTGSLAGSWARGLSTGSLAEGDRRSASVSGIPGPLSGRGGSLLSSADKWLVALLRWAGEAQKFQVERKPLLVPAGPIIAG